MKRKLYLALAAFAAFSLFALLATRAQGPRGGGPGPQTNLASGLVRYASAPFECDATKRGRAYFNTLNAAGKLCDGNDWQTLATGTGITNGAAANTLTKSNGTNLVNSSATDSAGIFTIAPVAASPTGTSLTVDDASGYVSASGTFRAGGGNFVVNASGLVTSYKGLTTFGNGVASIHTSVTTTGRATSVATTNLQCSGAVCPAGLYRVSVYQVVTTTGGTNTLSTVIGWNDGTAARTNSPAADVLTSATNFSQGDVIVRANGTNNITYSATLSATTGNPVFSIYVTLERLQ